MSENQGQPRRSTRQTKGNLPVRFKCYATEMSTQHSPVNEPPNKSSRPQPQSTTTLPQPANSYGTNSASTSNNNLSVSQIQNKPSDNRQSPSTNELNEFKQQMEQLKRQMQVMQKEFLRSTQQLQSQLLATSQQMQSHFANPQTRLPPQPTPSESQASPLPQITPQHPSQPPPYVNESEVSDQPPYSHSTSHLPHKKIYPLPIFTGLPEEWQTFYEAFETTTFEFGYNNLHNIMRLREAVKGRARDSVESLLANSANVNAIIEMLKETFGRPEQLIKSQLEKIRAIPPLVNDNLDALVNFANKISSMSTFLQNVRGDHHLANPSLVSELVSKLPANRQMQWAEKCLLLERPAAVTDFSKWLELLRRPANIVHDSLPTTASKSIRRNPIPITTTHNRKYAYVAMGNNCFICHGECSSVKNCQKFLQMTVNERWENVKNIKACFCCLKKGHQLQSCKSKRKCNHCAKFHNDLLHPLTTATSNHSYQPQTETSTTTQHPSEVEPPHSEQRNCHVSKGADHVLFQILPVKLYGKNKVILTYAFVDDGANVSMLDRDIASMLGIKGESEVLELQWLNEHRISQKSEKINLTLSGVGKKDRIFTISNVYISSNLSLPVQSCHVEKMLRPSVNSGIEKSYLPNYSNVQPKLILSLSHSFLTVPLEVPTMLTDSGPIVSITRLGAIIYGPIDGDKIISKKRNLNICKCFGENTDYILRDLHDMMKAYFDLEILGTKATAKPIISKDDERAITILNEKTKKVSGRYECPLLWKEVVPEMPDSYQMALNRLHSVERKMAKDTEYARLYIEKINDYLKKGYAKKLTQREADTKSEKMFYLPHFGVKNPNKKGIRIVFDAAAEVHDFFLNKALISGPDLNNSLISILFKFREAPIAVCGDIQEMFHQVIIAEEDRDCQRFLWRNGDVKKPVEIYRMERMIFGATCSPTIAQHVKNLNAQQHLNESPRAVEGIISRHYVDDYVDCFQTEEEAIAVVKDVIKIHKFGGFNLRNIVSNSERVKRLFGNPDSKVEVNSGSFLCSSDAERVLGIHWLPEKDIFCFQFKLHKVDPKILKLEIIPTKREMLSLNMSIYDPFGFLSDFMVTSKVLMQKVWKTGIKWDTKLPPEIYDKWKIWLKDLPNVSKFAEPRCYFRDFAHSPVDLHVFVDASEEAMAAVAYWRVESGDGVKVAFVMGKSSCAPTRYHTTPKLELHAAVMGVRMKELIIKNHTKAVNKVYFWSDSYTVIQWIRSDHRKYKQYVANRVSEILETSSVDEWRWCLGSQNPADEATRAKFTEYELGGRWQKGPDFLNLPETCWPTETLIGKNNHQSELELRSKYKVLTIRQIYNVMPQYSRFSKYRKLKRTIAWIRRYVQNLLRKTKAETSITGELTAEEESKAELYIFRCVQREVFSDEFMDLKRKGFVSRSSTLRMLNPFIGKDELIHAAGRISNAICVSVETRQPIILPKNHPVTRLLVEHYHNQFCHINISTTMSEIRLRFWVPSLRQLLNSIQSKCQHCKIYRAKPRQPQMAALPLERVTPYVRPFSYTGLDYFGPLNVTIRRRKEKRWVALFTCLSVRAVHLEIASDLSSDACLLCIRNFINRRGVPVLIRSDNGTNFVGIAKELQDVSNFLDNNAFQAGLTSLGIKWVYNTPANPSEGGVWERLVQSVKKALYIMLKEHAPKLETLQAVLIEAENMVNSRPLTHLPVTPDDSEPLTPNHFLLGCSNSTQTPAPYEPRLVCLRKQWRIAQNLKNGIWRQWIREYLPELTRRTKWCFPSKPLQVGNLVLICETDAARSQWKRGRIIKLHPGKDGVARSAEIRTTTGVYKRPVSKLAVLDVSDESETSPARSVHGGGDVGNGHLNVGNAKFTFA